MCACAPWIGQKKKNNDLGCAVLYSSVFPCTHRNIEGILSFQKNEKFCYLLRKTENPEKQGLKSHI